MEKNREKNVLLISMSILNNRSESYYAEENGTFRCCGISQLEAGTKYFLRKLQKENRVLDKIFIIESHKSRTDEKDVREMLSNPTSEDEKLNAVDFYKKRIWQYIRGEEKFYPEEPKAENREAIQTLRDGVTAYESQLTQVRPLKDLYKDKENLFVDIEVKEADIYQSIYELCDGFQTLAEDGSQIRLYVDMQGARRYETFIINSAVKMLEMRGISVEASSAVDFDPDNNKKEVYNPIVDTTVNDRIFEMVSGMNEFIKTGRGDTLEQFYKNSQKWISLTKEKELIEQIKAISDAISLCNVDLFDKELEKFAKILAEYDECTDGRNPLFRSFVVDLKADYERFRLLSDSKVKPEKKKDDRVLNQIKWCISKKLYQQALTLIESKVPDAVVKNKFLYYKNDEELEKLINNMMFCGWNTINDYLLEKKKNKDELAKIKPANASFVFIKYLFDWDKNGSSSLKVNGYSKNGKCSAEQALDRVTNKITNRGKKQLPDMSKLCKLMAEYSDIAKLRNNTNHAGEKTVGVLELEKKLTNFIKLYEKVWDDTTVRLDYSTVRPLKKK